MLCQKNKAGIALLE